MKVNRAPYNIIPKEWAFHPDIGPFVREILDMLYQLRARTGGDFDTVEESTNIDERLFGRVDDEPDEDDEAVLAGLQALRQMDEKGWKDLTSAVSGARVPPANAPTATAFGGAHTPQRLEYAFSVNDYIFLEPFHVNHDILNAPAYLHVHWSTDGTDTGNVQWECTILRALGHDQANFGTTTVKTVEQAAVGTAWRHMIAEVGDADAITFTEPDELILVTLRRIAASTDENTDTVFGLTVDFHYYSDREHTPQKAPDFYSR